jgi:peroxiredoxin
MSFVEHEPKAFAEFIEETGLKFRLVSADKSLAWVAFQCVG